MHVLPRLTRWLFLPRQPLFTRQYYGSNVTTTRAVIMGAKQPGHTTSTTAWQLLPSDRPSSSWLKLAFDAIADGLPIPARVDHKPKSVISMDHSRALHNTQEKPVVDVLASRALQLRINVHRGATGLGLAVDSSNKVAELVPGGQAETDRLLMIGDEVLSVDGVVLAGRPMGQVINREANQYKFVVGRNDGKLIASIEKLQEDHPVRTANNGSLELMQLTILRDADDCELGLDMCSNNTVKGTVPGGAAERSGGWLSGDVVVAVNGEKLAGRRLIQLLPPGQSKYVFSILRVQQREIILRSMNSEHAEAQSAAPQGFHLGGQSMLLQSQNVAEVDSELVPMKSGKCEASLAASSELRHAEIRALPTPGPLHEQQPAWQLSSSTTPSDKELLDFLLWREGRSREGLIAIYRAWVEEDAVQRRRQQNAVQKLDAMQAKFPD